MTLVDLAQQLAKSHSISSHPERRTSLLVDLQSQERLLQQAYRHFSKVSKTRSAISYAGEWLLDNYYVVQQAIRQIREDMPRGYYGELPKLGSSPLTGYPRIYAMAMEIINTFNSHINFPELTRFVQAYQQVSHLTIGELWALPIMLRLGIIQSLTQTVALDLGIEEKKTREVDGEFESPESLFTDETNIANCILSLRALAVQDWKAFFENVSQVEQILRSEPTKIYAGMDFETRDSYRRVIEELAQATYKEELDIAQETVWLAENAFQTERQKPSQGSQLPTSHIGFYLLGAGRSILENRLDYYPPRRIRWHRFLLRHRMSFYISIFLMLTVLTELPVIGYALWSGGALAQLIIAGLLFLIPATAIAIHSVNWLVTRIVPPRTLPCLSFRDGIPVEFSTMLVIPTLVTNTDEVESLMHQLELHYLSNANEHVHFALLSDFTDAPEKHMPDDKALVKCLKTGVQDLNSKYFQETSGPFFLFHRERQWNPGEECWMGWERKRGKLAEFNCLLAGSDETSYCVQIGNLEILSEIKYIITVDADTVLSRGSASRLIATLAHPLNQAVFDAETGKVATGYTVLQPRVEIKPTSANYSLFTQIFSGDVALDPYTLACSDVYHDLFEEGSYTGKGIYDVTAFERSLAQRVPENSILSHDLFEGLHGRVGLVTDVVVLEDYPPQFLSNALRWHRWLRGDWQLLPWLLPRVPGVDRKKISNQFSVLDRWKIFDNLRRSLMMPTIMACMLISWFWLPGSSLIWTLATIFLLTAPLLSGTLTDIFQRLTKNIGDSWFLFWRRWLRGLLALIFLPYNALIVLDAIVTVFVRMMITRKRLLQWTTAAHTLQLFGKKMYLGLLWKEMLGTSLFSLCIALLLVWLNPAAFPVASVFLLVWVTAPLIAYFISRPIVHTPPVSNPHQQEQLRCLARRTWLYFEHFVGPDDHWLPPDHFQENPRGLVAHHTSPTNIGLLLLSTLAAYDMGYIGLTNLTLRLHHTFGKMEQLQRYRGHFLNWYDTQSMEQLLPPYVSTVDSGNLAGCLLALKQGCLALSKDPLLRWEYWQGLLDTFSMLENMIEDLSSTKTSNQLSSLKTCLSDIREQILAVQNNPAEWTLLLDHLCSEGWDEFKGLLVSFLEADHPVLEMKTLQELRAWEERMGYQLKQVQSEISLLAPWLSQLSHPPAIFLQIDLDHALAMAWDALQNALPFTLQLGQVPTACKKSQTILEQLLDSLKDQEALDWCTHLNKALDSAFISAEALLTDCYDLSEQIECLFEDMDFRFLYDPQRKIFHLGYNVDTDQVDSNHYDLLASEARLASLIAIARGDVPPSHWLHLARPFTGVSGAQALLSWNGSMFEYLMPSLLTRGFPGTALFQTIQAVVHHQIKYGRKKKLPWGISEAGYYGFDAQLNYQYRGFGVPGLGFKRGLSEDYVVAPYASLLALSIQPQAVLQNIDDLKKIDMMGLYGFYESIDYTEARLSLGQKHGIVHSYYAHHQGMILLALANYLHDESMIKRFHAAPRVESVALLLQERIPRQVPIETPHLEEIGLPPQTISHLTSKSWNIPVDTPLPQVHYLSNGNYGTLITNTGSGYSSWQDVALTRWRPDTTLDPWGTWIYVQDLDTDDLWSVGTQPTASHPESQSVLFFPHKVEFQRRDHNVSLRMDITIAPDEDVEIRRLTLINHSNRPRRLRFTSYGEVVLSPQSADESHPAYNKLFVESEFLPELNALLFCRRPRSAEEQPIYLMHLLVADPAIEKVSGYESSRIHFIGRGGTPRFPAALKNGAGLTGVVGAPLDPIMAISYDIQLEPLAKAIDTNLSFSESSTNTRIAFISLITKSRQEALDLGQRYQNWPRVQGAFDEARYTSERELNQLDLTSREIKLYQQLLSALLYPNAALRADLSTLASNQNGQESLWPFAISGDYPILLTSIGNQEDTGLVSDLLHAHAYWRKRNIKIDLVILNMQDTSYSQELHNRLHQLLSQNSDDVWLNRHGGIFVVRADQMSGDQRVLLETAARVSLNAHEGALIDQLRTLQRKPVQLPHFASTIVLPEDEQLFQPLDRPENLLFDNGLGGFSPDGREYVIYLEPGKSTPNPWINVIANPEFGFTVSEAGSGFTWALNSGENRLTPWNNDPVLDMPGEALYLREEETGHFWSPTLLPAGADAPHLIRHGIGYSIFDHNSHGLNQHLRLFAAPDAPVKIVQLRLENTLSRTRRVTATYYAEWVLGTNREEMAPYIIPEFDTKSHTLLARNPYNTEFGERTAFLTSTREPYGLTTDRTEFLGRAGSYDSPAALGRVGLSANIEPGLDPCAALQIQLWLAPGEIKEVSFLLGQGANRKQALRLARQYQRITKVEAAWQALNQHWDQLLNKLTVKTPDPAMDLLLNRWLLYQSLSCRIWGRSALYQSSGAYGFRDQLQDVMALINTAPEIARSHILDAARRQFKEGDVLHWWHPPSGRGVRTRCSDDLLWLPYVSAHYTKVTGDTSILSEKIPFLDGEVLKENEVERYGYYETSGEVASLSEHCRRALEKGKTAGEHGLPLIGSHDWNDGLNRVGIEGRGESVWLGWFLYTTLKHFADICVLTDDKVQARRYRKQAKLLCEALETNAWDGSWYRRAYYDDGTPLGSANSDECKIDSLAQSWAVLSGAGDPQRAEQAMASVVDLLVNLDNQMILLFTPPFDKTERDPGYIKGYLPGIRENGGQYTHAATWVVWALAELGQGDLAQSLFRLLNPVYHADTFDKMLRYRVEPFVVAADVYSMPPYKGRGGWTWYTGSASWMYRLGVEAILGFQRAGKTLKINPCIPKNWEWYEITYLDGETSYHIRVENPDGVNRGLKRVKLDGKTLPKKVIHLLDDSLEHDVNILMG